MRVGKKHIETALLWFGVCTVAFCAGMIVGLTDDFRRQPKHAASVVVPFPPPAPFVAKPLEPPRLSPPHDIDAYAAPMTVVPVVINPEPAIKRDAATEHRLKCLTPKMRAEWNKLEGRFGALKVISTCDHSLYVAGTRRVSHHVSGKAVDFLPGNDRHAILTWLTANYHSGLIMTYPNSDHIHIDIGHVGLILASKDKSVRFAAAEPVRKESIAEQAKKPSAKPMHRVSYRRHECDDDDWF